MDWPKILSNLVFSFCATFFTAVGAGSPPEVAAITAAAGMFSNLAGLFQKEPK